LCTPITVTGGADCESRLGSSLDSDRKNDSLRLFKHEVYHFKLAFSLAVLGNNQIDGGRNSQAVLRKVTTASDHYTALYDKETNHGCEPAQSAWEQRIDSSAFDIDNLT
jgi:hypothetical protein